MTNTLRTTLQSWTDRLTGPEQTGTDRRFWIAFAAIAGLGIVLRFWNLSGAPIWMDEAVTLAMAELPLHVILFNAVDNHPPLTFAVQHVWQALVPDLAYARVPVATAGAATVIIVMLAARDLMSPRAALIAGVLFACSTGHIYYSQDARMYPYLMLGLALATWGGIGHARAGLMRAASYRNLYIIGGAIAIYSHMLGLVVMALIGFASLAGGIMSEDRRAFIRAWFIRNVVLFVIVLPWLVQIPGAAGTFPGLAGDNKLTDIQWFYRNITGFPGLGGPAILLELVLYGAAAASVPLAWVAGRKGLALTLGCIVALFPLVVLGLHLRQPMLGNKVLLPAVLGVMLGAAYTLSVLRPKLLGAGVAALLGIADFASSANELAHHIKSEDYPGAFTYADAEGYGAAPVLSCIHFAAAAVWEARPTADILYARGSDVIQYKGREYWRAAARSMAWLRAASAREIDEELGGGWLIEGGLRGALAGETQLAFMRPNCPGDQEAALLGEIAALGFAIDKETLIRGPAADTIILDEPLTRVTLFKRDNTAD